MTKAVVTEKLKADALEMAGGDQADGKLVEQLMNMKAKDLVKWMSARKEERKEELGEQLEEDEDCLGHVNRFSAFKPE